MVHSEKSLIEMSEKVVSPAVLESWITWGVPEVTIKALIRQREGILGRRKIEEHIHIPEVAYEVPKLPEIEAKSWGFAKIIDTEGTIAVHAPKRLNKINEYRYKYTRPRIRVVTTSYPLTEEIANIMVVYVWVERRWDVKTGRYINVYGSDSTEARAVRIAYLIEPHLIIPEKRMRAKEILTLYKESPTIRVT